MLLAALITLLSAGPHPAFAAPPSKTEGAARAEQLDDGGEVTADISAADNGHKAPPRRPGRSKAGGRRPADRVRRFWQKAAVTSPLSCPFVDGVEHQLYEYVERDERTSPPTVTVLETSCLPPQAARTAAAATPPSPTAQEITDRVRARIRPPLIQVDPAPEGFTGLESRFWDGGQDEVTVRTSIRGYTVTAVMRPTRYRWDTGERILTTAAGGSQSRPAAAWTYQAKDRYRVRVEAVWTGTWTFTGPGPSASGDLATIRVVGARDYPVNEIRSHLTDAR